MNTKSISHNSHSKLPPLTLLRSFEDVKREMRRVMLERRNPDRAVEILEAGCGSRWDVQLDGLDYRVIGVDLDAAAVNARMTVRKDLHEVIIGDLLKVDLGERQFDIIFNSFVLEHVIGAEALLRRFVGWLRPGGIVLIRIPDPDSVKGLITKLTPHWFHVWYYRVVLRYPGAGEPGKPPYPTIYEPVVSRTGIHDFAARHGLVVSEEFGSGGIKKRDRLIDRAINLFTGLVSAFSFGRYSDDHTDLLIVLRRPH